MSGKIRLLNANCNNNYLDCYCGNKPLCHNLAFNNCSEYLDIDYGAYSLIVCNPNSYQPLVNAYTYLPDNSFQTAITSGYNNLNLFVTPDGFSYNPNNNKAYIRFINLAYDSPCLDFKFSDNLVAIAKNIQYQEITSYYPLNSGTYSIKVNLCNSNYTILNVPNITLNANYIYTFYITGQSLSGACQYLLCKDTLPTCQYKPQPCAKSCYPQYPSYPNACNNTCNAPCSDFHNYGNYNSYYDYNDYLTQ